MPGLRTIVVSLVLSLLLSSAGWSASAGDRRHLVLVSKTHFDIGCSGLARDVAHECHTAMIGGALATIEAHGQGAAGVTFFYFGSNPANVQVQAPRLFRSAGPTLHNEAEIGGLFPPHHVNRIPPLRTWATMSPLNIAS